MRAGIVVNVTPGDRRRLEAIVGYRNAPQKHVWRAKIILASADGCGTAEIMRRSGKAKPVVWRRQARFMAEGVAGLTRDKMRKPGKPPLPVATVRRVVELAGSRHVEHSHAQILWFRREPWRRPQNSFRCERPLLPQPVH
jgi:hypothetical protein